MRVQVDGSVEQRHRESVHAAGGPASEVVGVVPDLVRRQADRIGRVFPHSWISSMHLI